MAGGKLSPRQQMINMMYLVLTALLAMNVSKEILDAFITIDEGQQNTRMTLENKLGQQMGQFSALAAENEAKYKAPYEIAAKVQTEADALNDHINEIKARVIMLVEGYDEKSQVYANDTILGTRHLKMKDDANVPTEVLYGSDAAKPMEGACERCEGMDLSAVTLRNRLVAFKDNIKQSLPEDPNTDEDEKIKASLDDLFAFSKAPDADGKLQSWEFTNFSGVPLAGVVSILSKIQSDVRAAQSDAIGYLFSDVEKASYKFTDLVDAVIPQATTVTTGSSYEAKVFLAAYDAQNPPEIRLGNPGVRYDSTKAELTGNYTVLEMEGTKGKVKIPASGLGSQMREGVIIFRPVGLPEKKVPFKLDYTVVAPTLVVSPTKMNVFYKGVDNPVSIGVPGFKDEDIQPSIDNGQISKGQGGYIVRVNSGTKANISCRAKLPDGSFKSMGPAEFRVKSVPDPVPVFGGKGQQDATIKYNELTASQGVIAMMKDFDFDLKFDVTKFEVSMSVGGQFISKKSNSKRVTPEIKELLQNAKNGQKVFIEGIRAKGPDGTVRSLGSLAFKVVR